MSRVFVYGTLLEDSIARKLLGRLPRHKPARLQGYARYRVKNATFPAIIPEASATVDGRVFFDLSDKEIRIFDDYEGIAVDVSAHDNELDYSRQTVKALVDEESLDAFAYVWDEAARDCLSSDPWSFEHFLEHDYATFWKAELEDVVGTA